MPIFLFIERIVTVTVYVTVPDHPCRNNCKISKTDYRCCHNGHYRIGEIFKRFVLPLPFSTPFVRGTVYFRWRVIISCMAKFAKRDRMNRANVLRREKNARPIRLNVRLASTCIIHVGFARLGAFRRAPVRVKRRKSARCTLV